jgi:hypothetical protein
LEHARASAVFSTPTINGYKRYHYFGRISLLLRFLGFPNRFFNDS